MSFEDVRPISEVRYRGGKEFIIFLGDLAKEFNVEQAIPKSIPKS